MSATASDVCEVAHRLLRANELHRFPFDANRIPKNGLYVLFEEGEEGHGGPRIVRVGTHTGQDQLRARLKQHFLLENKDRSIFRKNIGRCLLARSGDPYLAIWEQDFTTRAARLARPAAFDADRQAEVERQVTQYIRERFTFVVIPAMEKSDRLRVRSALVSLVSQCSACGPSSVWLGLHSPKERISASGLWQVNDLYKTPLTMDEVRELCSPMRNQRSGVRAL